MEHIFSIRQLNAIHPSCMEPLGPGRRRASNLIHFSRMSDQCQSCLSSFDPYPCLCTSIFLLIFAPKSRHTDAQAPTHGRNAVPDLQNMGYLRPFPLGLDFSLYFRMVKTQPVKKFFLKRSLIGNNERGLAVLRNQHKSRQV